MGFTHDQAADALKNCGNDLTKAIAYLFGEVEEPKGTGTQASPYIVDTMPVDSYDSVQVSNPQDLPDFLGQYTSSEAMEAATMADRYPSVGYDYSTHEEARIERPASSQSSGSSMDIAAEIEDNTEPDYGPNVKTEGHLFPKVVISKPNLQYWVALVNMLARFAPFADPVLAEENPTPFIAELQRLVYYIRNFRDSSRWYISADELAAALPSDYNDEDYFGDEVILGAFEQIKSELELLSPVFESFVESVEEQLCKDLMVLEIDADVRRSNLYHTLNVLFWEKNFVKFGQIKYKEVAPLVTYQLIGDSTSYSVPFELQETIYPEVYSDKALLAVENEVKKMREAETSLQQVSRNLMDLNVFEGKRITSLLRQSTQALDRASKEVPEICDARDDLAQLTHGLDLARTTELGQQTEIRRQAAGEELGKYEKIAGECNLQPYQLLGVILSEAHYYVRLDFDSYLRMDEQIVVDFEDVASIVEQMTRRDNHLVTLMYGVKEGLPAEFEDSEEESMEEEEEKLIDLELQVGNDRRECDSAEGKAGKEETISEKPKDENTVESAPTLDAEAQSYQDVGLVSGASSVSQGVSANNDNTEISFTQSSAEEVLTKDTTNMGDGSMHTGAAAAAAAAAEFNPSEPHGQLNKLGSESALSGISANQEAEEFKQVAPQASAADAHNSGESDGLNEITSVNPGVDIRARQVAERVVEQFQEDERNSQAKWL